MDFSINIFSDLEKNDPATVEAAINAFAELIANQKNQRAALIPLIKMARFLLPLLADNPGLHDYNQAINLSEMVSDRSKGVKNYSQKDIKTGKVCNLQLMHPRMETVSPMEINEVIENLTVEDSDPYIQKKIKESIQALAKAAKHVDFGVREHFEGFSYESGLRNLHSAKEHLATATRELIKTLLCVCEWDQARHKGKSLKEYAGEFCELIQSHRLSTNQEVLLKKSIGRLFPALKEDLTQHSLALAIKNAYDQGNDSDKISCFKQSLAALMGEDSPPIWNEDPILYGDVVGESLEQWFFNPRKIDQGLWKNDRAPDIYMELCRTIYTIHNYISEKYNPENTPSPEWVGRLCTLLNSGQLSSEESKSLKDALQILFETNENLQISKDSLVGMIHKTYDSQQNPALRFQDFNEALLKLMGSNYPPLLPKGNYKNDCLEPTFLYWDFRNRKDPMTQTVIDEIKQRIEAVRYPFEKKKKLSPPFLVFATPGYLNRRFENQLWDLGLSIHYDENPSVGGPEDWRRGLEMRQRVGFVHDPEVTFSQYWTQDTIWTGITFNHAPRKPIGSNGDEGLFLCDLHAAAALILEAQGR
jgi:hypothetical protein